MGVNVLFGTYFFKNKFLNLFVLKATKSIENKANFKNVHKKK
jgi:hypothetical protein